MPTNASLIQGQVNTLTGGLNTEATPLNFPFGFTTDEINVIPDRRGKRSVRTGIALDALAVRGPVVSKDQACVTHLWSNAGGVPNLNFFVVQVGDTVSFYDTSVSPLSNGKKSFSIDLGSFRALYNDGSTLFTGEDPATSPATIDAAFVGDKMVLVHPSCEPLLVCYDGEADSIMVSQIALKIRDFEYLGDETEYLKDETGALSTERQYDSYNSGWRHPINGDLSDDTPALANTNLAVYNTATSRYPRLTLPWFAAKDASGDFDEAAWRKLSDFSSLSGNGSFILFAFLKDRSLASGISGIPKAGTVNRPRAVGAFQRRIFYSGVKGEFSNLIYFTKVIETENDYSVCHQVNDPTSELTPDLVDNDGGVIQIDEARNIVHLHSIRDRILVFAENGVWAISGRDGVFRAGDYFVSRLTDVGMDNRKSFIDADGTPVWWSQTGIHSLEVDNVTRQFTENNIAISSIQTFLDGIESAEKQSVQGAFDNINKKAYWLYKDKTTGQYLNLLVFDTLLRAWSPFKFSVDTEESNSLLGITFDNLFQTVDSFEGSTFRPLVRFWVANDDSSSVNLTVAEFSKSSYLDWGSEVYPAYVESNFDFSGDLKTRKSNQSITVMLENIDDSSCIMKSFWEFRDDLTASQEVFRPSRFLTLNDTPVITRNKIRGRGRVLTVRFEATPGKGFTLLGFETWTVKNDPV